MHANLALTLDDVCGTWRVVRTEIPRSIDPDEEFLHFFPDGSHFWEFPLLRQPDKTWRFQYELTATGARLSTAKGHFSDIALKLEKGLLLVTPSHGHTTWFQRIPLTKDPSSRSVLRVDSAKKRPAKGTPRSQAGGKPLGDQSGVDFTLAKNPAPLLSLYSAQGRAEWPSTRRRLYQTSFECLTVLRQILRAPSPALLRRNLLASPKRVPQTGEANPSAGLLEPGFRS